MVKTMKHREARRDSSYRASKRAQRVHLSMVHPTGKVDCVCEKSAWFFRKRKSVGCDCRGRRHGQPKLGRGPCCDLRRESAMLRSAWRQERHLWLIERDVNHRYSDD